jgi:hypothetical protein
MKYDKIKKTTIVIVDIHWTKNNEINSTTIILSTQREEEEEEEEEEGIRTQMRN